MTGGRGLLRRCEEVLQIDIGRLTSTHRLSGHTEFNWEWSRAGEALASARVAIDADGLLLNYNVEHHRIAQRVEFVRTPCRFGGTRAWFACPSCGRRCAIVYGIDVAGRFSCRLCMRLVYSSEFENAKERLWRKQLKLEARLGNDGGKPKWTRWNTYGRICEKIDAVEGHRIRRILELRTTRKGE